MTPVPVSEAEGVSGLSVPGGVASEEQCAIWELSRLPIEVVVVGKVEHENGNQEGHDHAQDLEGEL